MYGLYWKKYKEEKANSPRRFESFKTKHDVDRHVQNILGRVRDQNERSSKGYSIANLYLKVDAFDQAEKHVTAFLSCKENYAPAHKLLGKIHESKNKLEESVQSYRRSLELDTTQSDVIVKICEIYCQLDVDPGIAQFWAEELQKVYPSHEVAVRLRERIYQRGADDNKGELLELLSNVLVKDPRDVNMRVKLLKLLLHMEQYERAYNHAIDCEKTGAYPDSLHWYQTLVEMFEVYKEESGLPIDTTFHLHMLHALFSQLSCMLSLKGPADCSDALYKLDQYLAIVMNVESESHAWPILLREMIAQYFYMAGTLCLYKAQKRQVDWSTASSYSSGCYLVSFSIGVPDTDHAWFSRADEASKTMYNHWYKMAALRLDQVGHMIRQLCHGDSEAWMLNIKSLYATKQGSSQLYDCLFPAPNMRKKKDKSFICRSSEMSEYIPHYPTLEQLAKYDNTAHLSRKDSLNHIVWIALQYYDVKKDVQPDYDFKVFENMQLTTESLDSCAVETLCQMDMDAFVQAVVRCTALSIAERERVVQPSNDKPKILPVLLCESLCSVQQAEWWRVAYRFYSNTQFDNVAKMRLLIQHGLESIRIHGDLHGIDSTLIVHLARNFQDRAMKVIESMEVKNDLPMTVSAWQDRARHYWSRAIDQLTKILRGRKIHHPKNRWFVTHEELTEPEIEQNILQGRYFLACDAMHAGKYEQAIKTFAELNLPEASFHQAQLYDSLAEIENNTGLLTDNKKQICVALWTKSREAMYVTLDRIRLQKNHELHQVIGPSLDRIDEKLVAIEQNNGDMEDSFVHLSMHQPSIMALRTPLRASSLSNGHSVNTSTPFVARNASPRLRDPVGNTPNPQPGYDVLDSTTNSLVEQTPLKLNGSTLNEGLPSSKHGYRIRPSPERLDAQISFLTWRQDVLDKKVTASVAGIENLERKVSDCVSTTDEVKRSISKVETTLQSQMDRMEQMLTKLVTQVQDQQMSLQQMKGQVDVTHRLLAYPPVPHPGFYPDYGASRPPPIPPAPLLQSPYRYSPSPQQIAQQYGALQQAANTCMKLDDNYRSGYPPESLGGTDDYGTEEDYGDYNDESDLVQDWPFGNVTGLEGKSTVTYAPPSRPMPGPGFFSTQPNIPSTVPQGQVALGGHPGAPLVSHPNLFNSMQNAGGSLTMGTARQPVTKEAPPNAVLGTTPQGKPKVEPTANMSSQPPKPGALAASQNLTSFVASKMGSPMYVASTQPVSPASQINKPASTVSTFGTPSAPMTSASTTLQALVNVHQQQSSSTALQALANVRQQQSSETPATKPGIFSSFTLSGSNGKAHETSATSATQKPESTGIFSHFSFGSTQKNGSTNAVKSFVTNDCNLFGKSAASTQSFAALAAAAKASNSSPQKDSDAKPFQAGAVFGSPGKATGDRPDEYEPSVDFKPVIPLPDLVEVRTGEEGEEKLFTERAKLYRYDDETKQWKERGVGEIKVLKNSTDGFFRVLMRREQVFKVCANHYITADMKLFDFGSKKSSWCWTAMDFADEQCHAERLAIRFKTVENADQFKSIFDDCVQQMINGFGNNSTKNAVKPDESGAAGPLAKQSSKSQSQQSLSSTGQGNALLDQFKIKANEWDCDTCCVRNKSDVLKCVACQTVKPGAKVEEKSITFTPGGGFSFGSGGFTFGAPKDDTISSTVGKPNIFPGAGSNVMFGGMKPNVAPGGASGANTSITFGGMKPNAAPSGNSEANTSITFGGMKPPAAPGGASEANNSITFGGMKPTAASGGTAESIKPCSKTPSAGASGVTSSVPTVSVNTSSPLADIFKIKEDEWECDVCCIRNKSNDLKCQACSSPKPGAKTVPSSDYSSGLKASVPSGGFKFTPSGVPSSANSSGAAGEVHPSGIKPAPMSFSFSAAAAAPATNTVVLSLPKFSPGGASAGKPTDETVSTKPFTFGSAGETDVGQKTEFKFGSQPVKEFQFSSTPVASQSNDASTFSFTEAAAANSSFNFSMNKSLGIVSSTPNKPLDLSAKSPSGEYYHNADGDDSHIHFEPIVRLEKVEVKTGEEDEEVLFVGRAKLYRFIDKEWKERGVGDVKLLRHKDTELVRVLMRRDHVLKICCNHYLSKDMELKPMSTKAWIWFAVDYTELEGKPEQLCIRFRTEELAAEFKKLFDICKDTTDQEDCAEDGGAPKTDKVKSNPSDSFVFKSNIDTSKSPVPAGFKSPSQQQQSSPIFTLSTRFSTTETPEKSDAKPSTGEASSNISVQRLFTAKPDSESENDDEVKFICEVAATPEQIQKARRLMLPDNFYLYEQRPDCPGCIGCTDGLVVEPPPGASVFPAEDTESSDVTSVTAAAGPEVPIVASKALSLTSATATTQSSEAPMPSFSFVGGGFSFADVAATSSTSAFSDAGKKDFKWEGSGTTLFSMGGHGGNEVVGGDADTVQNKDIHFEPIINLPEIVEIKTGEEDEDVMYSQRSKLYRYDGSTKQWKERGVGEMKVLKHKTENRYRLLMRREQVLKLCCNHAITKELSLEPLATSETAWCWFAMDYSDGGKGSYEQLAIRFKNIEHSHQFKEVVNSCIDSLKQAAENPPLIETSGGSTADTDIEEEGVGSSPVGSSEKAPLLSSLLAGKQGSEVTPTVTADDEDDEEDEGEWETEDQEEEEDEDQEDEQEVLFEKRATLFNRDGEEWKMVGMGNLRIISDDDVFGSRIFMETDKNEVICNHVITIETTMIRNDKKCTCEWAAMDFSNDDPIRQEFLVQFSSHNAVSDFMVVFQEGKELAQESDISEIHITSAEIDIPEVVGIGDLDENEARALAQGQGGQFPAALAFPFFVPLLKIFLFIGVVAATTHSTSATDSYSPFIIANQYNKLSKTYLSNKIKPPSRYSTTSDVGNLNINGANSFRFFEQTENCSRSDVPSDNENDLDLEICRISDIKLRPNRESTFTDIVSSPSHRPINASPPCDCTQQHHPETCRFHRSHTDKSSSSTGHSDAGVDLKTIRSCDPRLMIALQDFIREGSGDAAEN